MGLYIYNECLYFYLFMDCRSRRFGTSVSFRLRLRYLVQPSMFSICAASVANKRKRIFGLFWPFTRKNCPTQLLRILLQVHSVANNIDLFFSKLDASNLAIQRVASSPCRNWSLKHPAYASVSSQEPEFRTIRLWVLPRHGFKPLWAL